MAITKKRMLKIKSKYSKVPCDLNRPFITPKLMIKPLKNIRLKNQIKEMHFNEI
ncbi:Uncharacterised protein [uncultured archaeon]|nr:Uncharacterised protein [uncultured archaeon]